MNDALAGKPNRRAAPEVHAIVLNWRDPGRTNTCVESLLAEPEIATVWVVDNETDGELADLDSEPRVSLVSVAENRGFSAGVNIGLRAAIEAGAGQVLVINNDALLAAGSLKVMLDVLDREPQVGMIAPAIEDHATGHRLYGGWVSRLGKVCAHTVPSRNPTFLTWACVLVRSEVLQSIGLLDESYFMYWEDVEFSRRMIRAGHRLAVAQAACATHETSSSHTRAGGIIAMYSAAGLATFALSERGLLRASCLVRLAARFARAVATGRTDEARWVAKGARLGWNAEPPVYRAVLAVHKDINARDGSHE